MSAALGFLVQLLVDVIARLVAGWRRDRALKAAGRAEAEREVAEARARALRRISAVRDKTTDDAVRDLDAGRF